MCLSKLTLWWTFNNARGREYVGCGWWCLDSSCNISQLHVFFHQRRCTKKIIKSWTKKKDFQIKHTYIVNVDELYLKTKSAVVPDFCLTRSKCTRLMGLVQPQETSPSHFSVQDRQRHTTLWGEKKKTKLLIVLQKCSPLSLANGSLCNLTLSTVKYGLASWRPEESESTFQSHPVICWTRVTMSAVSVSSPIPAYY